MFAVDGSHVYFRSEKEIQKRDLPSLFHIEFLFLFVLAFWLVLGSCVPGRVAEKVTEIETSPFSCSGKGREDVLKPSESSTGGVRMRSRTESAETGICPG